MHLSSNSKIKELPKLNIKEITYLNDLISNFDITDAKRVKSIENKTNHDVKAVEYFLKEKFKKHKKLDKYSEFIHFACTSEDINNLSYALMIKDASEVVNVLINKLEKKLKSLSKRYSGKSMLSRTHGQSASPTTMGKEFSNYFYRINKLSTEIKRHEITGKINDFSYFLYISGFSGNGQGLEKRGQRQMRKHLCRTCFPRKEIVYYNMYKKDNTSKK